MSAASIQHFTSKPTPPPQGGPNHRRDNMKTQQQTIDLLMEMIKQANPSDTDQRMDWQDPKMARSSDLFGHLVAAIRAIGGADRFDHWVESGDDQ